MQDDDAAYAAHCQRFRDAGFTADKLAAARRDFGHGPNSVDPADRQELASLLKEPTESELPAVLEKHAARLAELGHYDMAADVQLASERLSREGRST
jgi:hypothetical protein